eukprot:9391265-Prorocentrum_lima.AAC.1
MTSSLVGSEMCIRDRLQERSDETDIAGQPLRSGWDFRRYVQGTAFVTVSYTHLTLPTICSV